MKTRIYRQGDTLLRQIGKLPEDTFECAKDELGRVILATGEQSGHAHAFRENNVRGFSIESVHWSVSRNDDFPHFVEITDNKATLRHELSSGKKAEHDEIEIPIGIYESAIQVVDSALKIEAKRFFVHQIED